MNSLFVLMSVVSAGAFSAVVLALGGLPYDPLRVAFQVDPYAPPSISAEANGSRTPPLMPGATETDTLTNGDFTIISMARIDTTLGDGVREATLWDLDFQDDPNFENFPTDTPLESAMLTLELTPKSTLTGDDFIRIDNMIDLFPVEFQDLEMDRTVTLQLELLEFYSSEEILDALTSDDGQISMTYADDSIVSQARLVLVSQR